jgi:Putative Actinobacterial Holin-X, holin superfamily III
MDTIQENVEDLVEHVTDYIELQKELLMINAKEKAASAISQTVIWMLTGVLVVLGFAFLSIALALWIGNLLESTGYGFLIVGSLYTIAAILFFTFRESLLESRLNELFLTKFTTTNHE